MIKPRKFLCCHAVVSFAFVASFPAAIHAGQATLVKDILPGGVSSYPQELTVMNGALYFNVLSPLGELWKSDGTPDGTVPVKDIYPGEDGSASRLKVSGGKLFFRAFDALVDDELWVTDGTTVGTVKIDINPAGSSEPDDLVDMGGVLYFSAYEPTHGRELWMSDGTPGGTFIVADLKPGGDSNPTRLTTHGNRLFFSADAIFSGVPELCVSDGTALGTTFLQVDTSPNNLKSVGSLLFFQAAGELYASNGTSAVLVKDINPSGSSDPQDMGAFGAVALFSANNGSIGQELWRSDGTSAGTYLIKDIDPRPVGVPYPYSGWSWPRGFTTLGSISLFAAQPTDGDRELWRTDGTEAGTFRVRDIIPGASDHVEGRFTPFDGALYFDTDDGIHGNELWKTDGTEAGTVLVWDVRPGPEPSYPWQHAVLGNVLYFNAYGDGVGHELWRYDPAATPVNDQYASRLALDQNYPNPFNPTTTISFQLDRRQHVTLSVFDVRGELVRVLVNGTMPGGPHREKWDGRDNDGKNLASGVYFLQLRASDHTLARKMVMLK